MIATESRISIRCDSCSTPVLDSEGGDTLLLGIDASDLAIEHIRRSSAALDGWSENGEGLIHCPDCPPLELTQDAIDERRRERERTGLTLF